jgi:hypothetical protein
MRCAAPLTACNGFVLARDWLAAAEGRIPWTKVREHCGVCCHWIRTTFGENTQAYFTSFE